MASTMRLKEDGKETNALVFIFVWRRDSDWPKVSDSVKVAKRCWKLGGSNSAIHAPSMALENNLFLLAI